MKNLFKSAQAQNFGSPYKTMRVNNFNKLHIMASLTHNEKSGVYKVIQGGIFKPTLLCMDYQTIGMGPEHPIDTNDTAKGRRNNAYPVVVQNIL
jgi:hypothetical protein